MDFDPKERVLSRFRFRTSVPNFVEIGSKLRPWEYGQTQFHRDHTGDLIICPILCYSNGTDNKTWSKTTEPEMTIKKSRLVWIVTLTHR